MAEISDPELLRRTGEALYGSLWQSALSRDLRVTDRTVRRWVMGETSMPSGLWRELHGLAKAREGELVATLVALEERTSNGRD